MLGILSGNIFSGDIAALRRFLDNIVFHRLPDFIESRLSGERLSLLAADFEAVIIFGIMAGRYHNAAVIAEFTDRKIKPVGRYHTDIDNINAGVKNTGGEGVEKLIRGNPHIAANRNRLRFEITGQSVTDSVGNIAV